MIKSINYAILGENPGNFKDMLLKAKEHGFDAIEVIGGEIESYGLAEAKKAIEETGVKVSTFFMPFRPAEMSKDEFDEKMSSFELYVKMMKEVGCDLCFTFIRSSSDDFAYEENYQLHVTRYKPVAEILAKYQMKLALEFIGPKSSQIKKKYPFVRTAEQLLPLCKEIGDNCGLCLDFWHWYSGSNNKDIFENIGGTERIYHVHLNDAMPGNPEELPDKPRELVGKSGIIDTAFLVDSLKKYGYEGAVIDESFSPKLKECANIDEKMNVISCAIDEVF